MTETKSDLKGPDLAKGVSLSQVAHGAMLLGRAHGVVKASPESQESVALDRQYETRLHDAYGLDGHRIQVCVPP